MGRDKRAWRKLVKKLRRKRVRRQAAIGIMEQIHNSTDSDINRNCGDEDNKITENNSLADGDIVMMDETYYITNEEWEAREKLIELQNAMKAAEEAKITKARAEEEMRIREEWEAKERKEKAEKEERERLELAEKQRQDEEYNQFLDFLCGDIETPPMRFVMPENSSDSDQEVCQLFSKIGACRFGDACKLVHLIPTLSQIILIPNFFYNFLLAENLKDEYDTDLGLECDEKELYKEFKEFYDDVLPEFRKHGNIVQFKVCRNLEPHLRGNVYIQYDNIKSAVEAFRTFNGRFYNGRQISLRFVKIDSWKAAICWSFLRSSCIRGRSCNYMHVFRNPTKEFVPADRDFKEPLKTILCTPTPSGNISKRSRWTNESNDQVNCTPSTSYDLQTRNQSVSSNSKAPEVLNKAHSLEKPLQLPSRDKDLDSHRLQDNDSTSHKQKSKKTKSHRSHKKSKKQKKKKSKKSKKDSSR